MLNLPICPKMDGENNTKILISDTFPRTDCHCLDPCSLDVYKFQVCIFKGDEKLSSCKYIENSHFEK